jgi:hypothetical protein
METTVIPDPQPAVGTASRVLARGTSQAFGAADRALLVDQI